MKDATEKKKICVSGVLKKLSISKAGYYSWKKRKKSKQAERKERIIEKIQEIHEESYQIYGAPKITERLRQQGEMISERTVGKYMRENGLKAHYIKPYTRTTINSDFSSQLKNLLQREFDVERPDEVWCTDITYIWTYEDGFVYLTSVMDLYSRKIISWTLSGSMVTEEVLECIKKAQEQRLGVKAKIIHSDRGSQYVSQVYQEVTSGMERSYSKKGTPWDNACIESFHSLIKREWLNSYKILDYQMAYRLVFEYIECFYNTVRIHSHCGYISPNQYELAYIQSQINLRLSI